MPAQRPLGVRKRGCGHAPRAHVERLAIVVGCDALKYEHLYREEIADGFSLAAQVDYYRDVMNRIRPHEELGVRPAAEVYLRAPRMRAGSKEKSVKTVSFSDAGHPSTWGRRREVAMARSERYFVVVAGEPGEFPTFIAAERLSSGVEPLTRRSTDWLNSSNLWTEGELQQIAEGRAALALWRADDRSALDAYGLWLEKQSDAAR